MPSSSYRVTPLSRCLLWGEQPTRPTTSFARGCKLWSLERQFYEEERRRNMMEFQDRPYLKRQYPEIGRHYPGTWRVVDSAELDDIVCRLTTPTRAHVARAQDIRERSAYVRFVVQREKAKDITYRGGKPSSLLPQSAAPRLEGNHGGFSRRRGSSSYETRFTSSSSFFGVSKSEVGSDSAAAAAAARDAHSGKSSSHLGADVLSSERSSADARHSERTAGADVRYRFRGSRKWDKTAWAHVRVRGTSPLS